MKLIHLLLLLVFSVSSPLLNASFYPNFDANPWLTEDMKSKCSPYLLPLDHPLKPSLDQLFEAFRVTENEDSLTLGGFLILHKQLSSFVIVASHPAFPGYIFKLYLDSETRIKKGRPGWEWLIDRCDGASRIRKFIKKKKIKQFVVPDKWIYILPPIPSSKEAIQQPLLVVETDMLLVSKSANKAAWQEKVTKKTLHELYMILSKGYGSWFLTGNIPYTQNGQFAFIDTEYPKRNISLHKVGQYLSPEMAAYWIRLTE